VTQSRRQSAIEAVVNVLIGYLVALATQLALFPILGIEVRLGQNVAIGVIFTAVSLVRSFFIRRLFNRWHGPNIRREP
jgi:hypothetical protein